MDSLNYVLNDFQVILGYRDHDKKKKKRNKKERKHENGKILGYNIFGLI